MRRIKLIRTAVPILEGAGVHLKRAFGYSETPLFDPFLMLDDFRNDEPDKYLAGFPWHPHRGIETITYMLAGSAEHGDSLGNSGTIHKGEVQWMTAGSGIIHQEMPKPDKDGKMYGFQLWANLPAKQKMMEPRYRDIRASDIPLVKTAEGAEIKIICGNYGKVSGSVNDIVIEPQYWDVMIPANRQLTLPTPTEHNCFIYCYGGEAIIDEQKIVNRQTVLFEDGDEISIQALTEDFRFLFLCGKPLGEPISWKGPIVMNTKEEIQTAFRELHDGTFIK
ncbi:MAG: pirin family protein [Candidatus Cloacimonetes bacterium]|nr:pirin family protein [Candidatus Cloacimonadota bacterium]